MLRTYVRGLSSSSSFPSSIVALAWFFLPSTLQTSDCVSFGRKFKSQRYLQLSTGIICETNFSITLSSSLGLEKSNASSSTALIFSISNSMPLSLSDSSLSRDFSSIYLLSSASVVSFSDLNSSFVISPSALILIRLSILFFSLAIFPSNAEAAA